MEKFLVRWLFLSLKCLVLLLITAAIIEILVFFLLSPDGKLFHLSKVLFTKRPLLLAWKLLLHFEWPLLLPITAWILERLSSLYYQQMRKFLISVKYSWHRVLNCWFVKNSKLEVTSCTPNYCLYVWCLSHSIITRWPTISFYWALSTAHPH